MRALALTLVLILPLPLFARTKTDVVVMKNGDHLTGEIKGLSEGVLYLDMEYILGTSSVQWSKVEHLESKQLFLVKTENGSVYTGTLSTAETADARPVQIQVAETSGAQVVIDRSHVVEMDTTSERFFQRFNGYIDTGITYSKGNQSTQYNLGSEVTYPRERWGAAASFESTLSSSTGASASTRNQLDAMPSDSCVGTTGSMRVWALSCKARSRESVRQGTFGGGVGRYLKNTNRARVSLIGGFAGQNTEYNQSIASQNLASGLIATNLQFFWFNKTNGELNAVFLPAISQPGRVKFNMNATYYIKLTGNLSWNVSFYGNWDNRPPDGLSSSDYGSSSGLSWKFGNK